MARRGSTSAMGLRLAVLFTGLLVALRFSPLAFNVKGEWDGSFSDVSNLPRGLGPQAIKGLAFGQNISNGHFKATVDDGRLVVNYVDGPISARVDDEQVWQANFTGADASLRLRGKAVEDLEWDISKQSSVEGVGDVEVNVSHGNQFGVSVSPVLSDLKGTQLKALARSSESGSIQGRLEAQRQLLEGVDLSYSIENAKDDYSLGGLLHIARLDAKWGSDNAAVLKLSGDKESQQYNVTYMRDLGKLLRSDADMVVGFDNHGVYGSFDGGRVIGKGLSAGYKLSGRSPIKEDSDLKVTQELRLSHDLGKLTLLQGTDGPFKAVLESELTNGAFKTKGQLNYTFDEESTAPTFNVTLTRDLEDLVGDEAVAEIGMDDASLDGLYGRLAARRDIGRGFNVAYVTEGHAKSLEHSVELGNKLGYARLMKSGDDAPRVRLGYEFNA